MKYIKLFFSKKAAPISVIAICLLTDMIFFYAHGFSREATANLAYLEYLRNFPESIRSVRVEPLFVILTKILSFLIDSDIFAIILIKNALIGLELFLFYKITILFIRSRLITLSSIIFLNSSFAYFSMTDNLLRNHLGNLFLLIGFFFVFKLFQVGSLKKWEILTTSFCGGILIYSHILPTLIFDGILFALIIATPIIQTIRIRTRKSMDPGFDSSPSLRTIIFITLATLTIQMPSIASMIHVHANVDDYKISTPDISTPPITQTTVTPTPTQHTEIKLQDFSVKIFRTIFEYRLPGFSILFICLAFFSVYMLLKNLVISSRVLPLILLWLITYIGTKLDLLFGIGTLPYRFSLMLIFPTLLSILILINFISKKIPSDILRHSALFILALSFIGTNMPPIIETTLLKQTTGNALRTESMEKFYTTYGLDKNNDTFLVNGDSLEERDGKAKYLRNDSLFSTDDEDFIVNFMKTHDVKYVLFDQHRINEKGTTFSLVTNTNIETYKRSRFFSLRGEYIGDAGVHLTAFSFDPDGNNSEKLTNTNIFDCNIDALCTEHFEQAIRRNQAPITRWIAEIEHSNYVRIREYVTLGDNAVLMLSYQNDAAQNGRFSKSAEIQLKPLELRKTTPAAFSFRISSGMALLKNTDFSIHYLNLEKPSVDAITFSGNIQGTTLHYKVLTRKGYELFIHSIFGIMILVVFCATLLSGRIHTEDQNQPKKELWDRIGISVFTLIILIDLIGGNTLFLEVYKKIIGI